VQRQKHVPPAPTNAQHVLSRVPPTRRVAVLGQEAEEEEEEEENNEYESHEDDNRSGEEREEGQEGEEGEEDEALDSNGEDDDRRLTEDDSALAAEDENDFFNIRSSPTRAQHAAEVFGEFLDFFTKSSLCLMLLCCSHIWF
jgi:cobalamin biosynthesis protein CobT